MPRRAGFFAGAAAAALAACFAWLSWQGAARESASFDETYHMVSGRALTQERAWTPSQPNPPLLLRWLALPLPAQDRLLPFDGAAWKAGPRSYGLEFVYSNLLPPDTLLRRSRGANLALGVLLAALTAWWAFRLGSAPAALCCLALFAFMPPLLAHAHMATADIGNALLCTATLALLWRGARSPGPAWAAAAGFAAGLALAGKYTSGLMLPVSVAFIYFWPGKKAVNYAAWALAAAAGLWLGCLPLSPRDWLSNGLSVARELDAGHITYLLGAVAREGSWLYFPLAFLIKTPLPALLLGGAGLYYFMRDRARWRERALYLALPGAAWLLVGVVSNTQVGIRHVLPLYPLLCAWGGLAAARLWAGGLRAQRGALLLLLAWLAGGTIAASPWQLSYFNELAGGARGGHRYLLDSNLDWGQGLKELGVYARERGAGHIYLSYFGCGDPHAYGLKYAPVLMTTCARLPGDGLPPEGKKLLAVSVTNRLGVYYTPSSLFSWLDTRRPEKIAGNSIWVYDLTGDTEALKLLSHPALAQWGPAGADETSTAVPLETARPSSISSSEISSGR